MTSNPPSIPPSMPGKKNPRYPSKTCKYAGVTFRASRDKYQARIYKGNKEYNLGLFDVSADAALAYDVAHRLVKKISTAHGKERPTLEAYEADKTAPDWLDYGEDAEANAGLDPDKLNFLRPLDFKVEREKELNESRLGGNSKHDNCPKLEELRLLVRKESIRVTKIIIGASDGGTNNYRRKSKKNVGAGAVKDGSLGKPSKRRRKAVGSNKTSSSSGMDHGLTSLIAKHPSDSSALQDQHAAAAASAWAAQDDAYYQATGLGRPVPNPSLGKKKEHPFGPPPVIPMGPMARNNPQMMSHLSESTLKAMMEAPGSAAHSFLNHNELESLKASNGGHGEKGYRIKMEKGAGADNNLGVDDSNSNFSSDTLQAGNVSKNPPTGGPADYANYMGAPYYGPSGNHAMMGAVAGGNTANSANSREQDFNSGHSPENYREFFKNMRNMFPPGMGPGGTVPVMGGQNGSGMYGTSSDDFQRIMFARAMGHNASSMHGHGIAGMGSMMGDSSLNQANFADLSADRKKADSERAQMDNLRSLSMMQQAGGSLDRHTPIQTGDMHHHSAGYPNQNSLRSLPPGALSMLRQGTYASAPVNQSQFGATAARDQLQSLEGMYGMDRYSQHIRGTLQGTTPYGLNPGYEQFGASGRGEGGAASARDESFLQALGQQGHPGASGAQPYGNANAGGPGAGAGGAGYNPAYDDMEHLLRMSGNSRNQGKDDTHEL